MSAGTDLLETVASWVREEWRRRGGGGGRGWGQEIGGDEVKRKERDRKKRDRNEKWQGWGEIGKRTKKKNNWELIKAQNW